ncbi:ABC transporter substrate-binding protein [Cupriavidus sp. D384]|uniref:ABC transporter substrate-binding protein n=1 Tax=Cupriavidus sp. D384 TaxID=1538095 RepID=UPI0008326894|nr:ABC transporter substrate-binding protein [Cupriavidus sp. D384]
MRGLTSGWPALLLAPLFLLSTAPAVSATEVEDQTGRRVAIPARVERVAAIPIPIASMVMAVDGGASRLVGMHAASRADFELGMLGRMFPDAARMPAQIAGEGFVPNVEALAAAKADLVFQWGDRGDDIVRPIRDIGLPVITLRYGDSSVAAGWLRLVGAGLGKAERGESLARWFETTREAIAKRAAAMPAAERPRVLYLQRARSGLRAAGKGTSMDGDIRLAGGVNVAAGVAGFAQVDVEQLLAWDPQIVLLNNFEPGLAPADLYADVRLRGLAAVRERRIYSYPHGGFRWDPPSQETPLTLDWLFSLFHPQRAEPGVRPRIAEAYRMLYDYRLSERDTDDLLKLDANGASAHYRVLFGAGGKP